MQTFSDSDKIRQGSHRRKHQEGTFGNVFTKCACSWEAASGVGHPKTSVKLPHNHAVLNLRSIWLVMSPRTGKKSLDHIGYFRQLTQQPTLDIDSLDQSRRYCSVDDRRIRAKYRNPLRRTKRSLTVQCPTGMPTWTRKSDRCFLLQSS